MRPRVVIVVCDGLRPDRIDPVRTPALWRLREEGVAYDESRTVFPSETRVAAASLVTGAWPGEHGLLANDFYDPAVFPDRAVATANAGDLAAVAQARGRLLARPTLAERLARVGLRYAAVSTASPGTSLIIAAGATPPHGFAWTIHRAIGTSAAVSDEIERLFGPPPSHAIPRTATIEHAARVFTDYVLPRVDPDLAVFWCGEPDSTYHYRGVGSPEAAQAEAAADAVVARVLAWRAAGVEAGRTQVIVASDHGHVSGIERLDVAHALRNAGWPVVGGMPGDGGILVVPGAASFVHGLGPGSRTEREMLNWLADQPWFGAAFTRAAGLGVASIDTLGIAHPRQPDLVFTLRQGDEADTLGVAGTCVYDADIPLGGGMHGGLHRRELANVLLLSGSAMRAAPRRLASPAGLLDIAPTVLSILGVPAPDLGGRVLREALGAAAMSSIVPERLAPAAARAPTCLSRTRLGDAFYLDGLDAVGGGR
jgi:phosphonoacetate hydrolase